MFWTSLQEAIPLYALLAEASRGVVELCKGHLPLKLLDGKCQSAGRSQASGRC